MVLLKKIAQKGEIVVTDEDLSKKSNDRLMIVTKKYDDIEHVQGRRSETKTREKRRHGKDPVCY